MFPRSDPAPRPTWKQVLWRTLRRRLIAGAVLLALMLSGALDPLRNRLLTHLEPMAERFVAEYAAYQAMKVQQAQGVEAPPSAPNCARAERGMTGGIVFHRPGGCTKEPHDEDRRDERRRAAMGPASRTEPRASRGGSGRRVGLGMARPSG